MKALSCQRGAALVLTLLVTAVMVAIITEVIYTVHLRSSRTTDFIDGQRAASLSVDGMSIAMRNLKAVPIERLLRQGVVLAADGGTLEVSAEDETGKFPLNSIVFPNGELNAVNYNAYRSLLKSLGLDLSLSETLADWLDPDDDQRPWGAEGPGFYNRLANPYSARNGQLESIEGLLLVKGYTREAVGKLRPFVTADSNGLININSAPARVIVCLSEDITPEAAAKAVEYREKKKFSDTADIRRVPGFESAGFGLQGRITVKSDIIRFRSKARAGEAMREAEAVVDISRNKVLYWRRR